MYLLFSPMYLLSLTLLNLTKSFLLDSLYWIEKQNVVIWPSLLLSVAKIYMQLVFPEFFEKELHKFQDNLPCNLEICNINNWQKGLHWVFLNCMGPEIH